MNKVAAILLAAGRSERMGAFKPLLPFGNQTIIKHALNTFLDAEVQTVIVVVGPNADQIRDHLCELGLLFTVNPDPDGDMSSSIACGIAQLPAGTEAVLIAPADLPAIPAEVVTALASEWQKGARLVIPTWNERGGHPVLVDQLFFPELLALDQETGLRGLFTRHSSQVKRVAVNSPYIARDLDTWDDYGALHKEIFGVTPPNLA